MSDNLVIVESPSKAKTIEKFLGKKYKVLASVGHVRDLPKSKLGVDVEHDFEPEYITIRGKGPVIADLKKHSAKAKKVYIATDPDREGEAIAWHLQTALGLDPKSDNRIAFQEITKDAVKEAVKHPRTIDEDLVNSQQARRILDRLVGYSISPILWRKIMKGLSAGRVQSVATRLIVERERLINAFVPEEYWKFSVDFAVKNGKLSAEITHHLDEKLDIDNEKDARVIEAKLNKEAFKVHSIKKNQRKRHPYQPYTTSTMQQDASVRLNFSSSKTMMIAQKLYEGIRVKGGTEGLITYMRTDSTRVSEGALQGAKDYIQEHFGEKYHERRNAAAKKNAQDAHEAVRPTHVENDPSSMSKYLSKDELKLYTLIWERFVASQMSSAVFDSTVVQVNSEEFQGRAKGEIMIFDGFMKVYKLTSQEIILPELEEAQLLETKKVHADQKFTQPPSRYTEASLIKELEEQGIGRPSTYAPTLYTILKRGYVTKEKKALKPTELGEITNKILEENFLDFVEIDFTAEMEDRLDQISEGSENWRKVVGDYYNALVPLLEHAHENVQKYDMSELTDIDCEKCGSKMLIKKTVKGNFYACSNYPECKNTKPILKKIGIHCPLCEEGEIVERKTKKLKTFWGCSTFPECRFASWTKPVDKKCPTCDSLLSEGNGRNKNYLVCTNKECDYKEKR